MTTRIDFVPYPPTSFPFRDLLVLEQLALGANDSVCEIGVGSGATTARLAKMCRRVVGFEISTATVESLRYLETRHSNLEFVVQDITKTSELARFEGKFTRLIACDTLEHVNDPAAFFAGVEKLLAPGGEFLVTFPNEPKEIMHGVTRFDDTASLEALAKRAGLVATKIGAANLSKRADTIAEGLGWAPLRMVRKAMRRRSYRASEQEHGASAPQTFEETQFFKKSARWKKIAPAINLYWYGVLKLMDARGPAFEIDWDFRSAPFTNCQVFMTGKKSDEKKKTNGTSPHS